MAVCKKCTPAAWSGFEFKSGDWLYQLKFSCLFSALPDKCGLDKLDIVLFKGYLWYVYYFIYDLVNV
jgi:hypothetical protein